MSVTYNPDSQLKLFRLPAVQRTQGSKGEMEVRVCTCMNIYIYICTAKV